MAMEVEFQPGYLSELLGFPLISETAIPVATVQSPAAEAETHPEPDGFIL